MIKKIFDKVVSALLPDGEGEEGHNDKKPVRPRQRVVNKLKEHFLTEMENETTTKSLLYHTSYTVYVREKEYDRLSPSFALTVDDAIKEFVEELRKAVKNYPGYQNHSKYWEMQLVAIPEDSEIEGISTEVMAENPIIIRSKLFADNLYDSPAHDDPNIQDDVHYVTTIHTKDSSKELPNAINLAALKGLTELAKDKYRVEFNLKDVLGTANPDLVDKSNNNIHATLHIVVGNFILGDRKYLFYNMTGDKLLVSGKNGSASNTTDEIHINDESVLNPTLEIIRDKKSGRFSMKAWGDVKMGGKRIESGVTVPLPHNSSIMINGDYQIDFKTK